MTKRFLIHSIAALIAISGIASREAGAQGDHRIRIGFGGGVSVPTSHAADALKSGVNGQGYLLINIGIPLRFNLGYQKFDYKDAVLAGSNSSAGTTRMLSGMGGLSINLLSLGPLTPYVTASVGAFNLKDEFTEGGTTTSTSKTNFGVDGGAGIRLKLGRLEAFAEGRVQNVYTDKGAIDTKSITTIPVTFGILF
jgi:hypothetical protein